MTPWDIAVFQFCSCLEILLHLTVGRVVAVVVGLAVYCAWQGQVIVLLIIVLFLQYGPVLSPPACIMEPHYQSVRCTLGGRQTAQEK